MPGVSRGTSGMEGVWLVFRFAIKTMPGGSRETSGMEAVTGKANWWEAGHEVHNAKVEGPLVAGSHFCVRFTREPKNGGSSPSTAASTNVYAAAGCIAQSPVGRSAEQLRGTMKLGLLRCSGVPNRRV